MDTKVCNLCAFVTGLFSPNGCLIANFDILQYVVHAYAWSTIYYFSPAISSMFWRGYVIVTFVLSFVLFEITRNSNPGVIELERFSLAYDEKGICHTCQVRSFYACSLHFLSVFISFFIFVILFSSFSLDLIVRLQSTFDRSTAKKQTNATIASITTVRGPSLRSHGGICDGSICSSSCNLHIWWLFCRCSIVVWGFFFF
jgi:hypothetical protein